MRICRRFVFVLAALSAVLAASSTGSGAGAQDDWVIRSFDARYAIDESGAFSVTEDIAVDFGSLERHGIFRDIPVEYEYNEDSNRLIDIVGVSVGDGGSPVQFEVSEEGPNRRIKIGDPDVLVSGQQRYVINYRVHNGLNPFDDHDELYWNVTGGDWEVTIERATATIVAPGPAIERVTCYQGVTGSTDPCESSFDETSASFEAGGALPPGSELTVVVGLRKGLVEVGPPVLVDANRSTPAEIQSGSPVETAGDTGDGPSDSSSESGGGMSSAVLFGIIAGMALVGASIAVAIMILIRRRFLRY